jgi:catechol 2,3-dioxygenase-like lactoylglutathione lyase family enzyme
MSAGLQHIGIEVSPADVEPTVAFFEALGFERVEPPAALHEGFTWVERDGTQVHLMHEPNPVVPPRAHLAVVVPDFKAAVERLRGLGFEVGPGREHWDAPRAHTVAPGGHRIELMERPPA